MQIQSPRQTIGRIHNCNSSNSHVFISQKNYLISYVLFVKKNLYIFFIMEQFWNWTKKLLKQDQASLYFENAKQAEAIGPIVFNVTHSC